MIFFRPVFHNRHLQICIIVWQPIIFLTMHRGSNQTDKVDVMTNSIVQICTHSSTHKLFI